MMQIRGVTGEVKWSYMTAAIFGPWRIETTPDGAVLDGNIVSFDKYRISKEGLTVSVTVGRSRLVYPVVRIHVHNDGTLTAHLGPRLSPQGVAREQSSKEEAGLVRQS